MRDWYDGHDTVGHGDRRRETRHAPALTGQLLVASPILDDPNFDRAVVYILSHDRTGSFGVILNRATETPVAELLAGWDIFAGRPAVIFEGGPVEDDTAICLARAEAGTTPPHLRLVDGPIGTLDLSDPTTATTNLADLRIFRGYAGWGPGQLAGELRNGAWIIAPALPADVFAHSPDDLWHHVLRRQGGLVAAIAHYPANPTLN